MNTIILSHKDGQVSFTDLNEVNPKYVFLRIDSFLIKHGALVIILKFDWINLITLKRGKSEKTLWEG